MAIYICLGIAALIALLLIAHVRLVLSNLSGEFIVRIRYLFISVRINKPAKGKAKKEEKGPKEQPHIVELLRTIRKYENLLRETAGSVLRKLKVDRLYIRLVIHDDDAAKTALLYGEACAVVYSAAAFLNSKVKISKREISVVPSFNDDGEALFECSVGISLFNLFATGLSRILQFILLVYRDNKKITTAKDGAVQ